MPLFPVILPVPFSREIKGKEKVAFLRKTARTALKISASYSEVPLGNPDNLQKNEKGAPLPFKGKYWSLSHKPALTAAVWGNRPIGIDIEEINPRSEAVRKKIVSEREEELGKSEDRVDFFFRVWTAKEAVLKAEGIGLAGLAGCRVTEVPGQSTMLLDFKGKPYRVHQIRFQGHWAALVTNGEPVDWILLSSEEKKWFGSPFSREQVYE